EDKVPLERLHRLIQSADFCGRTTCSLKHFGRQVLRAYSIGLSKNYCPADRAAELAHIARPCVFLEGANRIRRRGANLTLSGGLVFLDEEFDEGCNIFEAIPQSRHLERQSHPEIEVRAKLPALYLVLQRKIRCGDQTYIHGNWPCRSNPSHLLFFKNSQQSS